MSAPRVKSPAITKLELHNFRSFRRESISFKQLTILVGPNASGKSNLLDALRFLSECMRPPLLDTIQKRGGFDALRYRDESGPMGITVSLKRSDDPNSSSGWMAEYALELGVLRGGTFHVNSEECFVQSMHTKATAFGFNRKGNKIQIPGEPPSIMPGIAPDSQGLFPPLIGGALPFARVYQALRGIAIYDPDPEQMRMLRDRQRDAPYSSLLPDASNTASILLRMERDHRERYDRIHDYLRAAVSQIDSAFGKEYGSKIGLVGKQFAGGKGKDAAEFEARDLSDGTLRLLGLLVALYQPEPPLLMCIEEPERFIHPSAAGVVWDALREASERTQIIITTHSPDVLDNKDVPARALRILSWEHGGSVVRRVDASTRQAIDRHDFTAGELLRANALRASATTR